MSNEEARTIFAENLKKLMYENRINQKDLCSIVGVSSATVSDWLSTKKFPRIDKIQMIADYFGVSLKDMYEETRESVQEASDDQLTLYRLSRKASPQAIRAAIAVLNSFGGNKDDID